MPTTVVDINVSASTGAVVKPTYNDIVVFGSATASPSAGFNNADRYSSASDVESDFGQGSDVATASSALEEMGVSEWIVVVAERSTVSDEVVGDSDTSATDTGTVANTPIYGDESTITVSLDGSSQTVEFKAESPPDATTSPNSGEAFVNTATGEVVTGDQSSGSADGIEVSYEYVDWSSATDQIDPLGADLAGIADFNFTRAGIGDLDEVQSWASTEDVSMVGMLSNGADLASEDEALSEAHDVAGYVSSGNLMMVAHKSGDDVASYVLGQLGVNRPWFDPFWDGDGYPFATNYYSRANVGDPATGGTFEGGDAANQSGPVNVIINVEGTTVLSNSLSTAGQSSNYQFFDISRTESFIAAETERALKSLRLSADKIPYTTTGRSQILGAIRGTLNQYARGSNAPLSEITVTAPTIAQISDNNKANRVFPGITITGTLAGNVHEFQVDLNIRV